MLRILAGLFLGASAYLTYHTCSDCLKGNGFVWRVRHTGTKVISECVNYNNCFEGSWKHNDTTVCFTTSCGHMPDTGGTRMWWYEGEYTDDRCDTRREMAHCVLNSNCAVMKRYDGTYSCEYATFVKYVGDIMVCRKSGFGEYDPPSRGRRLGEVSNDDEEEQKTADIEESDDNEEEEQKTADIEESDDNEEEEQKTADIEESDDNEEEEQKTADIEESDDNEEEEQKTADIEESDDSEEEEQKTADIEESDDSEKQKTVEQVGKYDAVADYPVLKTCGECKDTKGMAWAVELSYDPDIQRSYITTKCIPTSMCKETSNYKLTRICFTNSCGKMTSVFGIDWWHEQTRINTHCTSNASYEACLGNNECVLYRQLNSQYYCSFKQFAPWISNELVCYSFMK